MYVIFKEDKLLEKISFWSRNDMYEHQLFDDTKYIFEKENAVEQILNRVSLLPSTVNDGYYINYNYVPLYDDKEVNKENLDSYIQRFNALFFSEGSLNVERNHLINISLDIDFIMEHQFRPNIINQSFKDYVRSELLNKQSTLRDYNINQVLK
tara:strand:- start:2341 stop:2799 length:459 start_codon:yes stop_codon:yes gene_type:complete